MTTATKPLSCSALFALFLLFGCSDDADPAADDSAADDSSGSADESSGAATAGDGSSSTGTDIEGLYDCVDPGLVEARPLVGPGYDPGMGGLVAPLQDEYLVSSTVILVKPEMENDFNMLVGQITATLDGSAGMVAYSLAIEPTCGFARTITVWRSEADMMGFVLSDAHATAMARTTELAVTGKVTKWELAADAFPPTWDAAREQLAMVAPFGY